MQQKRNGKRILWVVGYILVCYANIVLEKFMVI